MNLSKREFLKAVALLPIASMMSSHADAFEWTKAKSGKFDIAEGNLEVEGETIAYEILRWNTTSSTYWEGIFTLDDQVMMVLVELTPEQSPAVAYKWVSGSYEDFRGIKLAPALRSNPQAWYSLISGAIQKYGFEKVSDLTTAVGGNGGNGSTTVSRIDVLKKPAELANSIYDLGFLGGNGGAGSFA